MKRSLIRSSVRAIALVLGLVVYSNAWAAEMINPVTGETETYANTFTGGSDGTGTDWNDASNWDTSVTPFISGDYSPSLVSNKTASTATAVDGWTPRVGAYDGATVTWSGGISKIQAGSVGAWLTADATSTITIASFGGNQLEGSDTYPLKLTSAKAGGITWSAGLTSASNTSLPFWYYLKGDGTVVYGGDITVANAQVIKAADVTLSGNATPSVESKTLVTFGSGTTKTFTADAAIKVYDTDGTTLKETVAVTSVRSSLATIQNTTSALTTADAVGTCELVQCTDGIVLYYVDGDPSAVVAKTYTPSININFTSGTALSTAADVGLADYAVPGTSWNNLSVANNATLSSLNKIDSTGAATASPASVTITNTRGEWHCSSLVATSDLRAGYIDENSSYPTPTVTVSGIPYDQYKVIVYTATDAANKAFGYITVNGTNYTYSEGALTEGTSDWGNSGAADSADAIAEGVNTLVTPAISGATLTVVGHRGSSSRGCIAAVQIVKVEQEVSENDLLIELDGDRTYTFDEAKAYSGTVYVTGEGTLTFDGAASTAATLHIGPAAAVNMTGSVLTPTTVTGNGTVVYDGAQPSTTLGFSDAANWQGTVWVKNVGSGGETSNTTVTLGSDTSTAANNTINNWGNANSRVKFTNVRGHVSACNCAWTLVLEDDGDTKAWYNNNGWTGSSKDPVFAKLAGDGTFYDTYNDGCRQNVTFTDASEFTGTFNVGAKRIGIGGTNTADNNQNYRGTIEIVSGAVATIASGKTWTSAKGFRVNGTLNVDGTLSCSASTAVSGSGTVVFTGRVPTPTGDTWWKNANWTGTVQVNGYTSMTGNIPFNSLGNANSIVELKNVTGYLQANFTCTPKLKVTGTLSLNNGSSGKANAFKVGTLLGSGTISGSSSAPTAVFNVTSDWSGFTGGIGLNSSKCVVFGETIPDTLAAGTIYISEGAVAEIKTSDNWWATGGIVVDGTLKATGRGKWGGGTAMTLGDTGILELTSTSNTEDYNDYSDVTGTGTIKYSSTAGWRLFPNTSAKMPATTLTIQTELADSLIIACTSDTVIGNLAGSKNIRSDWGNNSANGRTLTVTQSKETEWSGKFVSNRVTQFNVNPGASTTGTLTLSGTQTISIPATISGSVNLTGTWVGATTVSGTFGGTGTLTGNLTFSDGATFKAGASALTVSGTVTLPTGEGETLTIDATDLSAAEVTVLSSSSITAETDVSKVTVNGPYIVTPVAGAIKLVHAVAQISGSSTVYISLQAAVDALAQNNKDIVLLANANGATVSRELTFNVVTGEYTSGDIVAGENYILTTTALEGKTRYSLAPAVIAVTINDVRTLYSMINANSGIEAANAGPIGTTIEILSGDPAGYAEYLPMFDLNTDTGVFTKVTNPVAAVYEGVIQQQVYRTLADAVSAAAAEQTVKLLANVTLDATIAIDKTLTLDLNGYTITASGINAITTSGALAVEGSSGSVSVTSGNSVVLTSSAATLTVSGGATLSPEPTTNVSRSRVKAVTEDGTTTYSVEVIPGTIFSVY